MDKLLLMLQLQSSLNDATNGEKWVDGITKNGKLINWRRCIYMECAETIDSFAWKHWKNIDQEPNWSNVQIEVVDIWHFVMSLAIEEYVKNSQGGVENIAIDISSMSSFEMLSTKNPSFGKESEILGLIEKIMLIVLDTKTLSIDLLLENFFLLAINSNLNLSELYKLYVGKNILNQFRQDHGYKDGSYIKVWAGEEDNVVMQKILNTKDDLSPDELYNELTRSYFALNKGV